MAPTLPPDDIAPYVLNLGRAMRYPRPTTLEAAARELAQMGVNQELLDRAVAYISELIGTIGTVGEPPMVRIPDLQAWYPAPSPEDRCWPALRNHLSGLGWADATLDSLDGASSKIVANLRPPYGPAGHGRRGLVLGYVQSGKTTNFTAVIAKAADAGYRLFIVLSGLHNALRQQTQDRLSEQLWALNTDLWNRLTETADFKPATNNVDAVLATDQRVLVVIKKNASRLRALRKWLFQAEPKLLAGCPILIIDDEADQASVNTAKPDRQPAVINGLIRDIVNSPAKVSYIGYTATPFANVLIDPADSEDLYPRDFIVDLPRPSNYFGPEAIFGREPLEQDNDDAPADDGHNLIRTVPDDEISSLKPAGPKQRWTFEPEITPSLDAALRYFLLSTAARRVRGRGNPHATALIHTSQHIDVHQSMAGVVQDHLRDLGRRLDAGDADLLAELDEQWTHETAAVPAADFELPATTFADLRSHLARVAGEAHVITDNSHSTERLRFDNANPRVIVAVGGNTLSRGLTLEGLAVSYFIRSASAYDTALQMGRWFGYRNGYADLTRIWLTEEMQGWFYHLATVEAEIRNDIARYDNSAITPEQVGVRIRTHPKLAVTAASKMRKARTASMSYSGRTVQTILFNHLDRTWLDDNLAATSDLLNTTAAAQRRDRGHARIIGPVDHTAIRTFLAAYRFHPESKDLDSDLMNQFIVSSVGHGELTSWKIALLSRVHDSHLGTVSLGPYPDVNCMNRAPMKDGPHGYANIKALMSQPDRAVDLTDDVYNRLSSRQHGFTQKELAALRNTPHHGGHGDGTGLLVLYPISAHSQPRDNKPPEKSNRVPLNAENTMIGVGVVFPESTAKQTTVDYLTVDLSDVVVEVPDDTDLPDEDL